MTRGSLRRLGSPRGQQPLVGVMLGRGAIGVRVVGQNADHFTLTDSSRPALADHPFKLTLKSSQTVDSRYHLSQLLLSNGIGGRAGLIRIIGQSQKLFDCFKRKAQFTRVPNEGQPFDVGWFIDSLVSRGPGWCGN